MQNKWDFVNQLTRILCFGWIYYSMKWTCIYYDKIVCQLSVESLTPHFGLKTILKDRCNPDMAWNSSGLVTRTPDLPSGLPGIGSSCCSSDKARAISSTDKFPQCDSNSRQMLSECFYKHKKQTEFLPYCSFTLNENQASLSFPLCVVMKGVKNFLWRASGYFVWVPNP